MMVYRKLSTPISSQKNQILLSSNYLGGKYLKDCTLYVTLEPCVMCAGALAWAQMGKIVYGAYDEKGGFMRFGHQLLHPRTEVKHGVLEEECATIMQDFFRNKRT